jgi:hypothetical protein
MGDTIAGALVMMVMGESGATTSACSLDEMGETGASLTAPMVTTVREEAASSVGACCSLATGLKGALLQGAIALRVGEGVAADVLTSSVLQRGAAGSSFLLVSTQGRALGVVVVCAWTGRGAVASLRDASVWMMREEEEEEAWAVIVSHVFETGAEGCVASVCHTIYHDALAKAYVNLIERWIEGEDGRA